MLPDEFKDDPNVELRVARDTQKRMLGGIFAYPILWLILALGSHIQTKFPNLFWTVTSITIVATIVRVIHLKSLERYKFFSIRAWYAFIPWLMLGHSLTWGITFAISFTYDDLAYNQLMALTTAGLASGGINNFPTYKKAGITFIISLLIPALITSLFFTEQWVLALLLVAYIAFVSDVLRRLSKDYWQSLSYELMLEKQSRTDALTKLDNRRYFDEKLKELCHLTSRSNEKLTIAIVDCDHFKNVNDSYGHDVGDECLKHIASVLTQTLTRATDVCARFGGEEFSLILPGTDGPGARIVAERIRIAIESNPVQINGQKLPITVSIGCVSRVVRRYEPGLPDQLFKQADMALYKAKQRGRNRCAYTVYDEMQGEYVVLDD